MVRCKLRTPHFRTLPARMKRNEKDISTKQPASQTHARISHSHEYSRRTCRAQAASRQRPQTPDRPDSAQASTALSSEVQSYGFPKAARLLVRRDFLSLQRQRQRRHSPYFVVVTAPARTPQSRLGITATRRFGNAVVRNRMKRLLREFFRTRQADIVPAQDIVIIPQTGAETLGFAQVAEELGRILSIAEKAK